MCLRPGRARRALRRRPRAVPAGEVTLYSLAETILAPIWVLLAIGEVPSDWTLGGGVFVLSAVVLAAVAGLVSLSRGLVPPPQAVPAAANCEGHDLHLGEASGREV